ncbi:hypothetical protein [Streptomyces sp. NPDC059861]|uniref:hypothetical protein n=1 Tax=Streptomyces sp. NPDC059861 TaxID=3346974 RepID=UPI003656C3C2
MCDDPDAICAQHAEHGAELTGTLPQAGEQPTDPFVPLSVPHGGPRFHPDQD